MANLKSGMVTTFKCDRMWGRYTCDWFATRFPQFKGRELTFRSDRAAEIAPEVFAWLTVNNYL